MLMGKLRPREKTVLSEGNSMVKSNLGCKKMSALGSAVHITTLSCFLLSEFFPAMAIVIA